MKIALAVPRLTSDVSANIHRIDELISEACLNGAELILLPETALTGLINNDVYDHDIALAVSLQDKVIVDFRDKARKNAVWLCFGFLENENSCIYDSAVLIDPTGEISIHYRRINPQWRANSLPANQYSEGTEVKSAMTPFGKTAILICGDLFDDNVISMLAPIRHDFVLFPFARCFPSHVKNIHQEWESVEKQEYINQARQTNATVAMANYIGTTDINDTSFGGALVVGKNGELLASMPVLQEGILYCEL